MNTYRYEILEHAEDCYRVTEADGPSAPATGEYPTREAAEAAIEAHAGKPLDFEHGQANLDGETLANYWVAEFSA